MNIAIDDEVNSAPSAINGDFGTPATDEAAFVDEIIAALTAVYGAAVVKQAYATYNAVTAKYDIDFWLYGRQKPIIATVAVTRCECIRDFIA